jgi:hypothetical protein
MDEQAAQAGTVSARGDAQVINAVVISLFVAVLSIEYLVRERGLLHPYVILLPELLSGIAMIIVLARVMAGGRLTLDRRYVVFLALISVVMLVGFVIQGVPSGAVVAGIRAHLKFIPFFLLPAVIRFTPAQLKVQFAVLVSLFLMQTPLALYQRFIEFANLMESGDPVRGTATTSSALSILMLCGISAVVTLFLRRRLRLPAAACLIGLFVLPTTLNETKATLLLLPVALLGPMLFMPRGSRPIRRALPIFGIGAAALLAFISVYNYLIQYHATEKPLGEFVGEGSFVRYLYSGAAEQGANYIGRFDSVQFAVEHIGRDPPTFAFGYGAGNVSTSFLSQFDGQYAAYYDRFGVGMTQVTTFLWEVGVVGLAAYLLLYWFVFRDAQRLAREDHSAAILGQMWATVTAIMAFGLIYKSVFSMNEIGYLFWFYTGVVAGRAFEVREKKRATLRQRRSDTSAFDGVRGQGWAEQPAMGWRE